ncbi:MAG: hypothetical protein DMG57_17855 [Acidobacteria bacterium]|nr:MAG: hypothetical protein DMG57_17855 [Acidobacteriota bacterium]
MLLAYLYVIRVPLICGLVVAFMRYTALKDTGSGTELLAGVFDVSPLGAILIGLCMAWFTAACVVSADLTLHYAHDRFDLPKTPTWMTAKASDTWLWLKRHERLKKCWTYLVDDLSSQAPCSSAFT